MEKTSHPLYSTVTLTLDSKSYALFRRNKQPFLSMKMTQGFPGRRVGRTFLGGGHFL